MSWLRSPTFIGQCSLGFHSSPRERETGRELSCFYGREGVTQLTHILLGPSQVALPQVALPQVALPEVALPQVVLPQVAPP